MSRNRKSLKPLQGPQLDASDPRAHVAVSASAGSGKTQVLTARVIRLLLADVQPENILCLTFTKAAAAEMANRIGAQLASWVRMKPTELASDLENIGEPGNQSTQRRARQLFARVLDCPGGLRIQTIHSFAQALLAAFPAEAGIAPGFEPIEGRAEQELARTTLANLLSDAEQANPQLMADVQRLSLRLGENETVKYLMRCGHSAGSLAGLGLPQGIEPALRKLMTLPEASVEDYLAENCSDDRFDCDLLTAIAETNRAWNTNEGASHVERIERWLALSSAERAEALPDLALLVFTKGDERRKPRPGQVKLDLDYEAHADQLAESIRALLRVQNGARLAADMAAGLRAGQAFAAAYARAKRSAGVADFNDLIAWTRELLARPGMGEWVRYKLDRRTDHILVDESQDTNAAQWDIVLALAAEYFAGAGAAGERHRTIFMVGDFKQAIFRFQGTDPEEFKRAQDWVRDKSEALATSVREAAEDVSVPEFRNVSIDSSFRSAQAVLDVVDSVIDEVEYKNMGLPERPNRHHAFFKRPGQVELWKPFAAAAEDDGGDGEEGWIAEGDRRFAGALAGQVRRWIDEGPRLPSTGQPLTPGDVLVLVRSRGELASLIVARLFEEGVPVAGIDRLHLQKPLAVRDLLAAVAFAVQPNDDLNLANLLVSPLIGWDQDQLRDLACDRKGSLWRELRRRAGESALSGEAHDALAELLRIADFTTPSRFLETILSGPMQGRRKLYARLGLASRDPIDELMNSAIEFERSEIPSLDRFLAWFERGEVEIKRDPSAPANAVRVMTIHGAKGLEAPVVILADSTADPAKVGGVQSAIDIPVAGHRVPVLRPRKAEQIWPFDEVIANSRMLDLQEHMRLLYVGMTRAIDRLVVAGIDKGDRPENCWHLRVERALLGLGSEWEPDEDWDQVLRYRGEVTGGATRPKGQQPVVPPPEIPAWAIAPAPIESRPPRPLAPSALAADSEPATRPSPEQRRAAERGSIIHALLERLPDVAPQQREQAALRWLERSAGIAEASERQDIASAVCGLIADDRFSALFGPGSLGEAPIAATLADGRVIAGTVDRLLVEPERVLVVDYKTGRAPGRAEDIPLSHRLQMDAYRQALGVIFPGRQVSAALLYTASAGLFEL